MTNKIVIHDNSVELYEHYISDEKWERNLSFPKGGLTFNISNNAIKFFAYEDYLYRNCLMSMSLPIHITDLDGGIDGDYDDIQEIGRILDRMFPASNGVEDLTPYLKKREAAELYQPIGDYALRSEIPDVSGFVTDEELVEVLDDYYTKDESDDRFQAKGDYVSADTFTAYTAATNEAIQDLETNKADVSALTPYFNDAQYDSSAKTINFYHDDVLKAQIDARPFIKDGMVDSVSLVQLSGDTYLHIVFNTDAGKEPIDINLGDLFNADNYYTKIQSDERYQEKGDYVSASTFNEYTATTRLDIISIEDNKLDITAYTPTDLSNYYTKSEVYNKNEVYTKNEVDDKITSAGTFDPTRYYTKDASDDRFALKNEIPSLSGYATEEWVINKNYATRANFITYINNMQQQINSLIEAVSGCCSVQEDVYRWLTLIGDDDYICENSNKYEKQQYQVSHDGGIVWENVVPAQYQKGELLESDSEDCGYVPDPQYRWKAAPTSDYMCSGTSKYYKMYYEVSYDGGQTWQHVVPEQTKCGDLIQADSTDCGYIAPQYRWYTAPNTDYICSGTTKYQKQYYQVSTDGGQTWNNVSPTQTRTSSVIEYNSVDCGYVPSNASKYLTFIPSENGTFKFTGEGTIPNTASYSLDSGTTWIELESGVDTPTIPSGTKIMWKGEMAPVSSSPMFGVGTFSSSGRFVIEGNPMSLIYGDNFVGQKSLSGMNHTFVKLFKNCTKLTSIDDIALPATTLADDCYQYMFEGCTSLTTIPVNLLTATTLASGCYNGMFKGCTSLTNVVNLPATKMASGCYNSMFYGCTSLVTVDKVLPATTLQTECYHMMFKNCTNLTTVPAKMLPATTLKDRCYGQMFYGCKKLIKAPELLASTLVAYCYNGMFHECSVLNYIKCLATSINATYATTAWVEGVQTNSGTFIKAASMNGWSVCDTSYFKGIPCNWTIQNA